MKNSNSTATIAMAAMAAFLLILFSPAGGSTALAQDTAPAKGDEATTAEQEVAEQQEDLKRIKKVAGEILELISETAGIPITAEINIDIVNKAQVREFMLETLEKDYPDDRLERQYEALNYLGLVPADLEIRALMVDLITEQAGAFYNPENDTFYAISDLPPMFDNPMVEKTIIAHELTHALQDMAIDLFATSKALAFETDELYALMSTMEGMATVVMTVGVMPTANIRKLPDLGAQTRMQMEMLGSMPQMEVFNSAPLYLKETLISPYAEGASFIQQYLNENPEKPVASVIENLPKTSEQILHYSKYKEGDKPSTASLESMVKAYEEQDWNLLYRGGLGEFDLRVMMQLHEKENAVPIAAGWDAFQFAALRKGEDQLVAGASAWDSEEDAREFAEAFKDVLQNRWGEKGYIVYSEGKAVSFVAGSSEKLLNEDMLKSLAAEVNFIE